LVVGWKREHEGTSKLIANATSSWTCTGNPKGFRFSLTRSLISFANDLRFLPTEYIASLKATEGSVARKHVFTASLCFDVDLREWLRAAPKLQALVGGLLG